MRHFRKRIRAFLGLCIAGVAIGGHGIPPAHAQDAGNVFVHTFDRPIEGPLADAPADIGTAAMGLVLGMRGQDLAASRIPIRFGESARAALRSDSFRYAGFDVRTVRVSHIDPHPSRLPGRRIMGILEFGDALGRRAFTSYLLSYTIGDNALYVTDLALRRFAVDAPDIRLFVIPGQAFARQLEQGFGTHAQLLRVIAENALPVSRMRATRRADDYVVAAVSMDRLPANAGLFVQVSDAGTGRKIDMGEQTLLSFDGWRVAIVRGTMDMSAKSAVALDGLYAAGLPATVEKTKLHSVIRFVPGEER